MHNILKEKNAQSKDMTHKRSTNIRIKNAKCYSRKPGTGGWMRSENREAASKKG